MTANYLGRIFQGAVFYFATSSGTIIIVPCVTHFIARSFTEQLSKQDETLSD